MDLVTRYTPGDGELVCKSCGIILVEVPPVRWGQPMPKPQETLKRALAIQEAEKAHRLPGACPAGARP